jgi:hypothetical protein
MSSDTIIEQANQRNVHAFLSKLFVHNMFCQKEGHQERLFRIHGIRLIKKAA